MKFLILVIWIVAVVGGCLLSIKILKTFFPWLFSGVIENYEEAQERRRVFYFRKNIASTRRRRRLWVRVKKILFGLFFVISFFGFIWFMYIFYYYYKSGFGCQS